MKEVERGEEGARDMGDLKKKKEKKKKGLMHVFFFCV